ncbi:MAG: GAF domain-containing protein [Candidatus Eremiobacteraeota bacterium]|nr:GAF domain-containing protein [Candidatus Eremiobacteraeota bacterium]
MYFVKNNENNIFNIFLNSRIIKDLLKDIKKTSGLDVTLVDTKGNLIAHPVKFVRKDYYEIIEHPIKFIRNGISSQRSNKDTVLFKSETADCCFFISSVMSLEQKRTLFYLIGGPFISGSSDKTKERQVDSPEDAIIKPGSLPISILEPMIQEISAKLIESYSKIIANLYEEKIRSAKSLERLSGIYQINFSLTRNFALQNLLQMVLDKAIELLDARKGSILLLDSNKEYLKIFVANGLSEEIIQITRIKTGEGITGWVADEGKSRLLKNGVKDKISSSHKSSDKLVSAISVPLISFDEVLGVLNISSKIRGGDFNEDEMELLEVFAANAANAIRNARLYDKVQRKVDELSALFSIGSTIVSSLDRKIVLQQITDNAIKLLTAKAGSLMIYNEENSRLEIEVAVGLPEKVIQETKIKLGEGIAGKVALERKSRLLKAGIKDRESKSDEQAEELPSALCVPMVSKNKMIGVLNVKEKTGGGNFDRFDTELLSMLAGQAAIAIENAELHKSLRNLFINSIKALANAIEARDPYTAGHSERVTEYSVKIARRMSLPDDEIEKIRYAALLHDIGKINIKEEILNKPGKLTPDEYRVIQEHPSIGAKIMEPVKEFKEILPYMYHHHEWFNAMGYPGGVQGDKIPLAARIITVSDAFDAMTTDRPYRKAISVEIAINEISRNSGTQFDPRVVVVFINLYNEEKDWLDKLVDSAKKDLTEALND